MFAWLRRAHHWLRDEPAPIGAEALAELVNPPSPTTADIEAALRSVDLRLAELSDIPPIARTPLQWHEIDRLLDRRMRLTCPMVPVIPGRSS